MMILLAGAGLRGVSVVDHDRAEYTAAVLLSLLGVDVLPDEAGER